MTGQDFQVRLDSIVEDLQTRAKGKTVIIAKRQNNNQVTELPLSSDVNGVINGSQLTAIQDEFSNLMEIADTYSLEFAPVQTASEAFRAAREPHQALIDAASAARQALNDALENDAAYQTAKANYDAARGDADYVAAREAYELNNVSENYGNLGDAKGKYVV